jgi:hypothetical protein
MRGFRPCLAVILPMLLAVVATAQVSTGEPGFDVIGRWAAGTPNALVMDGRVAYLGHGARLEAVNVSNAEVPESLAFVDLSATVGDLAARNGYVYVTTDDGAFSVVDARDPRQLRVIARLEASVDTAYRRVELAGDVAYCAGPALSVIDIGEPAAPRVVATVPTTLCLDVAAEGSRLYAICDDGLHVLDTADPLAPVPLAVVSPGDMWHPAVWMQAHDGLVYIGFSGGIRALRITDPTNPGELLWAAEIGFTRAAAFSGAEIYTTGRCAARYQGWATTPDWLESDLGEAMAVAVDGDLLVVAHQWAGLVTYALSEGTEPQLLAMVEAGAPVRNVTIDGTRAWLACYRAGVRLLDLSNPASPRLIGSLATGLGPVEAQLSAQSVCARGDRAVVTGIGGASLLVVEAAPDGTLREIFRAPPAADGSFRSFNGAVSTSDGWIVWGDGVAYGLRIAPDGSVDLAPLAWPSNLSAPAWAGDDLLYAFDDQSRLCLLTATASGALLQLGSVSLASFNRSCSSARSGLLWLGTADSMQVVDISDPANPRLRGRAGIAGIPDDPLDGVFEVAAAGSNAFALSRGLGLVMAEATDPDAPILRRVWCDGSDPVAIAALGDLPCLVDWQGMMTILRPQPRHVAAAPLAPAQVTRLTVAPNPCNPRTTITFTMADAGPATVRVFDARGRLVRQLHDGWLDTGAHGLSWSGDDDNWRPVATGVYLVRAESHGHTETARVTLVK